MGALSSSMAIAGAGLLSNPPANIGPALAANTQAVSTANSYANITVVSDIVTVLEDAYIATFDANLSENISESTYNSIYDITATALPSLADQPSAGNTAADLIFNTGNVANIGNVVFVSDLISVNQTAIIADSDLSRFCQVFMQSVGYISQANATLNSCRNAATLAQTFNPANGGMDAISTGGLNLVTGNLQAMSRDLANLGTLIDLARLDILGLPSTLLTQISSVAGGSLPSVTELLLAGGLPARAIQALDRGQNQFSAADEKRAYMIMRGINDDVLSTVKTVLGVTLPGVENMAQLLDPKLLFPGSYLDLVCPTAQGPTTIYIQSGTTGASAVNWNLESTVSDATITAYAGEGATNSYDVMKKIIPSDQALANKALSRSLAQVKQIDNTTLEKLGSAMASVQTNSGLGELANLVTPVPAEVTSSYQSALGNGTGANGTIVLVDVIGVATGFRITGAFANLVNIIGNLQSSGALIDITDSYANMSITLANLFAGGTPPDGSPTFDDSFTANLIPAAASSMSSLITQYPNDVENMSSNLDVIITCLIDQRTNQIAAEIDFGNLQSNSRQATMSWTTNLHDYGVDVNKIGANVFIEAIANTSSLSGQAVVASLREGLNIQRMQESGMVLDTQLSDQ